MRYLICGGRSPRPAVSDHVWNWVIENCREGDVIIHGDARGVDTHANFCAQSIAGVKHLPFPADWRQHGRAAGPIRNRRMIEEGKPDMVIAFEGGRGTANMIAQARKAGIEVVEIKTP